jgi:hypothetical protein
MAADKGQVVQLQQIHAAARNYQPRPYVCETEGNMYGDLDRLVEKVRESLKHGEQRWQEHLGGAGQMA